MSDDTFLLVVYNGDNYASLEAASAEGATYSIEVTKASAEDVCKAVNLTAEMLGTGTPVVTFLNND